MTGCRSCVISSELLSNLKYTLCIKGSSSQQQCSSSQMAPVTNKRVLFNEIPKGASVPVLHHIDA